MKEYIIQIQDVMDNPTQHMKERGDRVTKLDNIKKQMDNLERELMWKVGHINVAEWIRDGERDRLDILIDSMNREDAISLATWIIEMTGGKVSWD